MTSRDQARSNVLAAARARRRARAARRAALAAAPLVLAAAFLVPWTTRTNPTTPAASPPDESPGLLVIHTSRDSIPELTDAQLLAALADSGRPAGLARVNGRTFLLERASAPAAPGL